jgi:iron complex outermembrane recepter protein
MNSARRAHAIRRHKSGLSVAAAVAAAIAPLFISFEAGAQAAPEPADELTEVVISGDRLDVIPTKPIDSVFGTGKTLIETPRSVTSISNELLEKTIITGINDLVALTPGAFTQSFFGVAGSLDVRGSPGETYFRGMKRIDNPGNYPTPIGASDRIDIVRGPASPIYGPSKIGGYLNFVPKSARAGSGQYLSEATGEFGFTTGSWNKRTIHAEVGGPASIMSKDLGYYLYAESENSGSYYNNTSTEQTIVQASFDMNITDSLRTEFGGMYQYFKGNQVAGWNRLTQNLINTGTYVTGSPKSADTNGDGLMSQAESAAANVDEFFTPAFGQTPAELLAQILAHPNAALVNPGTTKLKGSQVLVNEDDNLEDDVVTLYFDMIWDLSDTLKVYNKSFFESLKNDNENAYGFGQYADTYAFEDKVVLESKIDLGSATSIGLQLSPSVRYQKFEHGDDFTFEYFDRRDISVDAAISTPIDRRTLATRGQGLWSDHVKGHFTDYALSMLADVTFFEKLNFLGGARYDYLDMASHRLPDVDGYTPLDPTDTKGAFSFSGSLSYQLPYGLRPYATYAKQSTLVTGQGGQIPPEYFATGGVIGKSELKEAGLKASLLDGHLYAAVDYFQQERQEFNAQDIVTNSTTRAKGWEAEARYVVTPQFTVTGTYTKLNVDNIGIASRGGFQFNYFGGQDLLNIGINPALVYGGNVGSLIGVTGDAHYKAGIPENLYSLNLMFGFDPWVQGLSSTVALQYVDSAPSGFTGSVILPSYTLVNFGLRYEMGRFAVNAQVKNLTDERYFRSNFPDLFGTSVVLPELPRNFLLSGTYKF